MKCLDWITEKSLILKKKINFKKLLTKHKKCDTIYVSKRRKEVIKYGERFS